jgi:uridine kinase
VDGALDLTRAVSLIRERRRATRPDRALLVAISGVDGGGKGYVAARIAEPLRERGLGVAILNVDGWLNLPRVRFSAERPAEHFYRHALRFDEMFSKLVLPLTRRREVRVEADFAEETADSFRRRLYDYKDVDIVLLEGIYLLQPAFLRHYDLKIWIECSFETALERAVARGQEALSDDLTVAAYRTIYFPAQRLHFAYDGPREAADLILINDPRLDGLELERRHPALY